MRLFSFGMLCEIICMNIVLSVTYSPNRKRWLSMWDVVDTTAPPEVIRSSTFEERRSRRSLCYPVANPMRQRQHLFIEHAHWWTGQKDKTQVAMTSVHSPIAGHECRVTSVCFSLDGKQILSRSTNNIVRVWDTLTRRSPFPILRTHVLHRFYLLSASSLMEHTLALSPKMGQLVYGR